MYSPLNVESKFTFILFSSSSSPFFLISLAHNFYTSCFHSEWGEFVPGKHGSDLCQFSFGHNIGHTIGFVHPVQFTSHSPLVIRTVSF